MLASIALDWLNTTTLKPILKIVHSTIFKIGFNVWSKIMLGLKAVSKILIISKR
jgi:hypothetical protein